MQLTSDMQNTGYVSCMCNANVTKKVVGVDLGMTQGLVCVIMIQA